MVPQIVGINTINAKYSRLSIANKTGTIEKCVVSGKWPDTPSEGEYTVYDVLDEYDPAADLSAANLSKKTGGKSFIQVVRDSWSNNEYYSAPSGTAHTQPGGLILPRKYPYFLKKAYENQITWKWHVQIPYAFWDKKFPKANYKSTDLRNADIEALWMKLKTNLCGPENANKPIFTIFRNEPAGEKWRNNGLLNPLKIN